MEQNSILSEWFDFEGRGRKDARISDGRVLKSEMFTNKVF